MQPEDRLDALLTALRQPERGAATASTLARRPLAPADAELAPLLRAAREVGTLSAAAPDPAFARDLRMRMLMRSAERRHPGGAQGEPDITVGARGRHALRPAPSRGRAPLWAGLAAAALLAVSLGTFTAAAYAGPASPLFGLHRLEQGIRVAAANDSASRTRLHMQYARQWLAALRQATSQHTGSDAVQSALTAMLQENAAAVSDATQVTDSATHADLQSAQAALQSDERAGLHAALGQVGWDERLAITAALGQLGETIPHVTQVHGSAQQGGAQVTIVGSGFQPGTQFVLDGRPVGQVVSTSRTVLVVNISLSDFPEGETSVGVSNPDGMAAQAPESGLGTLFAHGENATKTAGGGKDQETPTAGSHGGGKGEATVTPGGHGDGNGGEGTPTPQTTPPGEH